MIEVLVAMLILAVGLLGMASLQVRSVQDTGNSNLRSVAIYLANDMADRMRANSAAVTAGNYDSIAGASLTGGCLTTAGCTSAQMANHDKQEWLTNIAVALPADAAGNPATGTLAVAGDVYTITVSWTERVKQSAASTDTGSVTLTFEI